MHNFESVVSRITRPLGSVPHDILQPLQTSSAPRTALHMCAFRSPSSQMMGPTQEALLFRKRLLGYDNDANRIVNLYLLEILWEQLLQKWNTARNWKAIIIATSTISKETTRHKNHQDLQASNLQWINWHVKMEFSWIKIVRSQSCVQKARLFQKCVNFQTPWSRV